ncbi:ABC transporter permease [Roseateles asaccharophilus]|uniref:ABC transport system permease protein n=1 Tax=Roseateles asaccharophilus TaxID=582607 RepID=A0ABU2A6U6_9BURK|nr:ABC transporter permease [Roseateles asaccharophilus]MDR7332845.1 putative ABC transport system permease protein [Roseateles asaccharophilus]
MFLHYLELAWRNILAYKGLSALMVLALALGIGACMTTLTVYHVLSGDPIPHKSQRLFNVQLDAADMVGWKAGEEPTFDLTRFDATALLRDKKAMRQSMSSGFNTAVSLPDAQIKPTFSSVRYTSADFFAMFDAPWQHGGGWNAADDEAEARVAVLSAALNEKLFGGANSVGREVIVRGQTLRVIGVLRPWKVQPHFWDLTLGSYTETEDFYLPFSTAMALKMGHWGNMDCWARGAGTGSSLDLAASCSWIQYWVEFEKPEDAAAYRDYLVAYSEAQRKAGRFERPTNVRLRNVMDWLGAQKVLPADVRLQTWLAFGFLAVCIVNMVGLLLAKTLRRSGEIGVRRALGATRADIFRQFVVEAGVLGLAGAVLGLLLAQGGLWLVRQSPNDYARLAELDASMLALTLGLALLASLLAGLLPAWRAALVTPAVQLKVQ